MNCTAFQISSDDVKQVLSNNKIMCSWQRAVKLFERMDVKKIEQAALHGEDLDKQTTYAYEEIWKQYVEKKLVFVC